MQEKEYITITFLKNKKPICTNVRNYIVGDKGIYMKFVFAYNYGYNNMLGKIFRIQYLFENNDVLIDEFYAEQNGLIVERKIDDKCFIYPGTIRISLSIKDDDNSAYKAIPFEFDIQIGKVLYDVDVIKNINKEIVLDTVIDDTVLKLEKYIDENIGDIISNIATPYIKNENKKIMQDIYDKYENDVKIINEKIQEINGNEKKFSDVDFKIIEGKIFSRTNIIKCNDIDIYNWKISDNEEEEYNYYIALANSKILNVNILSSRHDYDKMDDDIVNCIIEQVKKNAYADFTNIIDETIRSYMLFHCFNIKDAYDVDKIKFVNWYNDNILKIEEYNDLSKELKIII